MLGNYIHIAWRNIRRNKLFSLISIGGLAIASIACLLVWLECSYEYSFDNTHPNGERIYRVTSRAYRAENDVRSSAIAPPAPAAFRKTLTGVDAITDITPYEVKSAIRSTGKPGRLDDRSLPGCPDRKSRPAILRSGEARKLDRQNSDLRRFHQRVGVGHHPGLDGQHRLPIHRIHFF